MINKKLHLFLIIQTMFILSSCSSLDGLRFWKSDEVDPDEPKELYKIENKKDVQIIWDISFKGENEIGNFEPAFSSKSIFFAEKLYSAVLWVCLS